MRRLVNVMMMMTKCSGAGVSSPTSAHTTTLYDLKIVFILKTIQDGEYRGRETRATGGVGWNLSGV